MAPSGREGRGFPAPLQSGVRPGVNEMIGRRLRLHYEDLQQQPLPDRLANLLEALEQIEDIPVPPRRN